MLSIYDSTHDIRAVREMGLNPKTLKCVFRRFFHHCIIEIASKLFEVITSNGRTNIQQAFLRDFGFTDSNNAKIMA